MTVLVDGSPRERLLADRLRELAVDEIERRGIDDVASSLALASSGVKALLWREAWSIETAFRVADALDLPIVRDWEGNLTSPRNGGAGAPGA